MARQRAGGWAPGTSTAPIDITDDDTAFQNEANLTPQELAKRLRNLRDNSENYKDVASAHDLTTSLVSANQLLEKCTKTREMAYDASTFGNITRAAAGAAQKLVKGSQDRAPADFVRVLCNNYVRSGHPHDSAREDPDAFSWDDMGWNASRYFQDAPRFVCMLGPLDYQPKVRKATVRRAKQAIGDLIRPDELDSINESNNKQETERIMEEMWERMQKLRKCPVPELICNSKSFGQTVENLFVLSFLVKSARIRLSHDTQQGMTAEAVQAKETAALRDNVNAPRRQFVIPLELADWERMRQIVKAEDCVMPHRDEHPDQLAAIAHMDKRKALQQPAAAATAAPAADDAGPSGYAGVKRGREIAGRVARARNSLKP